MRRKLPAEALEFFRKQGKKGGSLGGKKAASSMSPEQRQERARKAAAARWKDKPAVPWVPDLTPEERKFEREYREQKLIELRAFLRRTRNAKGE
jgi:hypothetical protein